MAVKNYLDQIRKENRMEDLLVRGAQVEVTYNGETMTLIEALTAIFGSISGLPTTAAVNAAISTAISQSGHAHFETAESVPAAAQAEENVMYLVMNEDTGHYDIYAKVGDAVVQLDDTTVNLTGYAKTEDLGALAEKDKVAESDLDDALKQKVHSHDNQTALNSITTEKIAKWDSARGIRVGTEPPADMQNGEIFVRVVEVTEGE